MTRTEPAHPIELALVAVLVALEAAVTLVAAVVALALALLPQQRPTPQTGEAPAPQTGEAGAPRLVAPSPPIRVMPPAPHPLALLAEQLTTTCTRRELQAMAGTRSNLPKAQLAALVVAACS
jgi:hypothetical protein